MRTILLATLTLLFIIGPLSAEEPQTKDPADTGGKDPVGPQAPDVIPPQTSTPAGFPSGRITQPLTSGGKLAYALRHSVLSPVSYGRTAVAAGLSQAINSSYNRSYGQGGRGFARRWGDHMGAHVVSELSGNWVTASLLHQDPRYYRSSERGAGKRVKYALSRVVVTRGDDGSEQFNASNLIGIAAGATASAAWHPKQHHPVRHSLTGMATSIAFDGAGKLIKEFIWHRR